MIAVKLSACQVSSIMRSVSLMGALANCEIASVFSSAKDHSEGGPHGLMVQLRWIRFSIEWREEKKMETFVTSYLCDPCVSAWDVDADPCDSRMGGATVRLKRHIPRTRESPSSQQPRKKGP